MTSPLDQIPRLAALLAETGLDGLELSGPAGSVALRRGGTVPAAALPPEGGIDDGPDAVTVSSPGIGIVLRAHPLHDEPLAPEGTDVSAGQVLALLRVGALLQPVRAPVDGILAAARHEEGTLAGYGDPLFDILPRT